MGRQPWSDRLTVEDCLALDMWVLKRTICQRTDWKVYQWPDASRSVVPEIAYRVVLDAGSRSSLVLRYTVSNNGLQSSVEYQIQTTTTPCRFGGRRYWFACPLVRKGVPCLKRARKLFLPPGGRFFGCRRCYNLTHRSAQEHDKRIDALLRLPAAELRQLVSTGTIRQRLLLLKTNTVLRRRIAKSITG